MLEKKSARDRSHVTSRRSLRTFDWTYLSNEIFSFCSGNFLATQLEKVVSAILKTAVTEHADDSQVWEIKSVKKKSLFYMQKVLFAYSIDIEKLIPLRQVFLYCFKLSSFLKMRTKSILTLNYRFNIWIFNRNQNWYHSSSL